MKPESTEVFLAIWNKEYGQSESKGGDAVHFQFFLLPVPIRTHTNEEQILNTHYQAGAREVSQYSGWAQKRDNSGEILVWKA